MAADPNEQPGEADPSNPQQPKRRALPEEELQRILADHKTWIETRAVIGAKADLSRVDLRFADLQAGVLVGANLQEADLEGADLERADLQFANLQATNLADANLREANLRGANLKRGHLQSANLQGAFLLGAGLQSAALSSADLQAAVLTRANLQNADLSGVNLGEAVLAGADLRGARNLLQAQLDRACGDDDVELPEGLRIRPCDPEGPS
jgi:uncharacterized protein YjbI with pentapeptide repeats